MAVPHQGRAQDEAVIDALAGVLAAGDERRWDDALLASAANHPDPVVRRHAALTMGRIGGPTAGPRLLELLTDPDSTVQQDAAFALGLLADAANLEALQEHLMDATPVEQTGMHAELVTAIAKTGGARAGALFEELLVRWNAAIETGSPPYVVPTLLGESWRLGSHAPVLRIAQVTRVRSAELRRRAVYSLSRLRSPDGAAVLLQAVEDDDAQVRAFAARALTRSYADTAGLEPAAIANRLVILSRDRETAVRINALRSLATFGDPQYAGAAEDRVGDQEAGVRMQAIVTLGALGGPGVSRVLAEQADRGSFATRRLALLALARTDRGTAIMKSAAWITDEDWRMRYAGAQALERIGGDTALAWLEILIAEDADDRVVASAFDAMTRGDSAWASATAGGLLVHRDPVVRTLAARQLERRPLAADIDPLVDAYGRALQDPISDARIAAVEALGGVASLGYAQRLAVEERLLSRFPSCNDYLVRRAAEQHLESVAQRWGPSRPITTELDAADYRDIARRILLPAERGEGLPRMRLETDRGDITITLYAADAPITVNQLLQLADQHYFDGSAWHRVVPNFVIQDGDPRGDGWGGPGVALRDEVNRRRYQRGTVGMALSGPDTGGSQFFITHSPQPHLDGTYTVIGQVTNGLDVVDRTTQGDGIRSVRRR